MMTRKCFIFMMVTALVYGIGWAADQYVTYEVDPAHSSVSFTIRHMVVSKVRGQFNSYSVTVREIPGNIGKSSVEAAIKTASIDTNNEKRDEHLRSADFFEAGKFPEITFKSKKIEKKGEKYIAYGTLTIHGVSKEIELPFEIMGKIQDPYGNTRVGIEAHYNLDRKDYGLKWNRTMDKGGLVVGDEVKVEILLELIAKKE